MRFATLANAMGLLTGQFSTKQMMVLTRSLSEAYAGNLPILRCFTLLSETGHRKDIRRVADAIAHDLRRGQTLEEALYLHENRFSRFFIASVVAGERSGQLDRVLPEIAAEYEKRLRTIRRITQFLLYPFLVFVVAVYIIPYVEGLVLTNKSLETYSLDFLWALRGHAIFVAVAAALYAGASRANLLRFIAPALIPVWPLGPVVRDYALARFFRNLGHLIESGLPLQHALRDAAATVNHPIIENKVRRAVLYVKEGAALHEAFRQTRSVPRDISDWVQVGEESGKMASICSELADYLDARALSPVRLAVAVLQAALVVVILFQIAVKVAMVVRGAFGL